MAITRIFLPLMLILLAFTTTGCSTFSDMMVGQKTNLDVGIKEVHAAALTALNDLEIKVRRESVDTLTGKIEGRTADGKDVIVKTKRLTDTATELVIHVGPFGDEAVESAIFDKTKQAL